MITYSLIFNISYSLSPPDSQNKIIWFAFITLMHPQRHLPSARHMILDFMHLKLYSTKYENKSFICLDAFVDQEHSFFPCL